MARTKAKRKKLPRIEPGADGLVGVTITQSREDRLDLEVGKTIRVDPKRAARMIALGFANLEESNG